MRLCLTRLLPHRVTRKPSESRWLSLPTPCPIHFVISLTLLAALRPPRPLGRCCWDSFRCHSAHVGSYPHCLLPSHHLGAPCCLCSFAPPQQLRPAFPDIRPDLLTGWTDSLSVVIDSQRYFLAEVPNCR